MALTSIRLSASVGLFVRVVIEAGGRTPKLMNPIELEHSGAESHVSNVHHGLNAVITAVYVLPPVLYVVRYV